MAAGGPLSSSGEACAAEQAVVGPDVVQEAASLLEALAVLERPLPHFRLARRPLARRHVLRLDHCERVGRLAVGTLPKVAVRNVHRVVRVQRDHLARERRATELSSSVRASNRATSSAVRAVSGRGRTTRSILLACLSRSAAIRSESLVAPGTPSEPPSWKSICGSMMSRHALPFFSSWKGQPSSTEAAPIEA